MQLYQERLINHWSVLSTTAIPCNIQWLGCSSDLKSESKTNPTPAAFLLAYVTYTGTFKESLNFNLLTSTGFIFIKGNSCINFFGSYVVIHLLFISHYAPSKYNPVT